MSPIGFDLSSLAYAARGTAIFLVVAVAILLAMRWIASALADDTIDACPTVEVTDDAGNVTQLSPIE